VETDLTTGVIFMPSHIKIKNIAKKKRTMKTGMATQNSWSQIPSFRTTMVELTLDIHAQSI
jgi:hypothetical protein